MLARLQPGDTGIAPKLESMFRSAVNALNVLGRLRGASREPAHDRPCGDITGNGISKLVFTILAAVAEAERDRIRERITAVKQDQRKRGRHLGGTAPFGFTIDANGVLVPVPAQQRAIRRARTLRARGLTLRAIREALARSGHRVSHVLIAKLVAETADR
jgi:DNA invertase Pin-like site-specific DNA recombinase